MDFVAVSVTWVGMLECEISKIARICIYRTMPGNKPSFSLEIGVDDSGVQIGIRIPTNRVRNRMPRKREVIYVRLGKY